METTTPGDRHVPIRTCVGCRRRRPQPELHRCVLTTDGTAFVSRVAPGRGAWICGTACLELAKRRRGFERAWRGPVPRDVFDRLRALLSEETKRQGGERRRPCETDDDDERLQRERGEEDSST